MKIAIGSDFAGFELKEAVREHLEKKGLDFVDFSPEARDYYDIVIEAIPRVQNKEFDCAILLCGSGMGMAQMANSYKGIRAAVCESLYSAKLCRAINNSNVLTMGGFLVAPWLGCKMVDIYLETQIGDDMDEFKEFLLEVQDKIVELEDTVIY